MLSIIRTAAIAMLLTALPLAAQAQDKLQQGLKVGDVIPHPFTATDQDGKGRDFVSLRGPKGLILLFNRSFDW